MSKEMFWLSMTFAMTAMLAFPYVLNRLAIGGLARVVENPEPGDKPQPAGARSGRS